MPGTRSTPLLPEHEALCQRAEHRLAVGLNRENLESFLDGIAGLAEPVALHARADMQAFDRILNRDGGEAPRPDDQL